MTTPTQAIALVRALLERNAAACRLTWSEITATGRPGSWRVTAKVTTFGHAGVARWTITADAPVPADPLAADIALGCA